MHRTYFFYVSTLTRKHAYLKSCFYTFSRVNIFAFQHFNKKFPMGITEKILVSLGLIVDTEGFNLNRTIYISLSLMYNSLFLILTMLFYRTVPWKRNFWNLAPKCEKARPSRPGFHKKEREFYLFIQTLFPGDLIILFLNSFNLLYYIHLYYLSGKHFESSRT